MTDKIASAPNIIRFPDHAERARRRLMVYLFNRKPNDVAAYKRALAVQRGDVLPGMFAGGGGK